MKPAGELLQEIEALWDRDDGDRMSALPSSTPPIWSVHRPRSSVAASLCPSYGVWCGARHPTWATRGAFSEPD